MDLNLLLGLFLCVFLSRDLVVARYTKKSGIKVSSKNETRLVRADNDVKFILYTRQTLTNPQISVGNSGLFTSLMNNKPIKVIVHGWQGSDDRRFSKTFREDYLRNEDANVITVDWAGKGSKNILYPMARRKVYGVADALTQFLDKHNRQIGMRLETIHILGHSLGAHIAGIAGYMVKTGKIGRITGMDPAGPLFSEDKPYERLSPNSALFVDVIHTCGNYLSMNQVIGHADFYPNGGQFIQPGCGIDVAGSCSHRRSYFLYLESVANRRAFPAVPCPSWQVFKDNRRFCDMGRVAYLGEGLPPSTRGVFYLTTNDNPPFGLGWV